MVFETLDKSQLKDFAPAALKEKLSRNEMKNLGHTKKYQFYSTSQIIDDLGKLGWQLIKEGSRSQKPQKRNVGKIEDVTTHMLRFQNPTLNKGLEVGGLRPEILITNAHNGKAAFKFHAGLFRLVCSNGLVIADSSFDSFKIRHIHITFEEVREYTKVITKKIPKIMKKINRWKTIKMDEKTQLQFATKALILRHQDLLKKSIAETTLDAKTLKEKYRPLELLNINRNEDKGNDIWHVFNRVQENLIKGNYTHHTKGKKDKDTSRKARSIEYNNPKSNIRTSILVNKQLWQLADQFAEALA